MHHLLFPVLQTPGRQWSWGTQAVCWLIEHWWGLSRIRNTPDLTSRISTSHSVTSLSLLWSLNTILLRQLTFNTKPHLPSCTVFYPLNSNSTLNDRYNMGTESFFFNRCFRLYLRLCKPLCDYYSCSFSVCSVTVTGWQVYETPVRCEVQYFWWSSFICSNRMNV